MSSYAKILLTKSPIETIENDQQTDFFKNKDAELILNQDTRTNVDKDDMLARLKETMSMAV